MRRRLCIVCMASVSFKSVSHHPRNSVFNNCFSLLKWDEESSLVSVYLTARKCTFVICYCSKNDYSGLHIFNELPNMWVIASIILSVYPCVMLSSGWFKRTMVFLKMLCKYLILQFRGSTVLLYFLLSSTGSGS